VLLEGIPAVRRQVCERSAERSLEVAGSADAGERFAAGLRR
jgi:hypothetical protein